MNAKNQNIAIVGATGAVGEEMLRVLERRNFPVSKLRLLASARSVGKTMTFRGEKVTVEELKADAFGGIDLALSTALSSPDARNAANIVLSGIRPTAGERSPIMPGFADSMSDGQIAALLDYLRTRFGNAPPWTDTADIVRDARRTQTVLLQRDQP